MELAGHFHFGAHALEGQLELLFDFFYLLGDAFLARLGDDSPVGVISLGVRTRTLLRVFS